MADPREDALVLARGLWATDLMRAARGELSIDELLVSLNQLRATVGSEPIPATPIAIQALKVTVAAHSGWKGEE